MNEEPDLFAKVEAAAEADRARLRDPRWQAGIQALETASTVLRDLGLTAMGATSVFAGVMLVRLDVTLMGVLGIVLGVAALAAAVGYFLVRPRPARIEKVFVATGTAAGAFSLGAAVLAVASIFTLFWW